MDNLALRMGILTWIAEYIKENISDEVELDLWFTFGIPDGATAEDIKEIAEDEHEFNRIVAFCANILRGQ